MTTAVNKKERKREMPYSSDIKCYENDINTEEHLEEKLPVYINQSIPYI